jgi:hypothetical protein
LVGSRYLGFKYIELSVPKNGPPWPPWLGV